MSGFRRSDVELACLKYEDEEEMYDFFDGIKEKKQIQLEGIGLAEYVEDHRPEREWADDDVDGEYIDVIFKIGDRYFRKSGTYSSWDSDEWDGPFEEVTPAKVQRTEWVNVNKTRG
jgi:hypothetical protein